MSGTPEVTAESAELGHRQLKTMSWVRNIVVLTVAFVVIVVWSFQSFVDYSSPLLIRYGSDSVQDWVMTQHVSLARVLKTVDSLDQESRFSFFDRHAESFESQLDSAQETVSILRLRLKDPDCLDYQASILAMTILPSRQIGHEFSKTEDGLEVRLARCLKSPENFEAVAGNLQYALLRAYSVSDERERHKPSSWSRFSAVEQQRILALLAEIRSQNSEPRLRQFYSGLFHLRASSSLKQFSERLIQDLDEQSHDIRCPAAWFLFWIYESFKHNYYAADDNDWLWSDSFKPVTDRPQDWVEELQGVVGWDIETQLRVNKALMNESSALDLAIIQKRSSFSPLDKNDLFSEFVGRGLPAQRFLFTGLKGLCALNENLLEGI